MNVLMGSSKDMLHFSPEVLEEIFAMLAPKDLISLAQTCTLFHKIIDQSDHLWAKVCFNKFKIRVPPANGYARRFYKNVLHSYGHLLGFWNEKEATYFDGGNFLHVKYSDGQLLGLALEASNESNDSHGHLISKPLFKISMDKEDDHCIVIKCSQKCCIDKDPLYQSDVDLQYIYKKLPAKHSTGSKSPASWYLVIPSRRNCVPRLYRARHYTRLQFPRAGPSSVVPIQPGLFTLTIAAIPGYPVMIDIHVRTKKPLAVLTYDENSQVATGLQITENRNWYLAEVGGYKFQVDLHRCSYLDQEVRWDKDLPRQPSLIPDVYRERFPDLPSDCLARVRDMGRPNHNNYWIVFDKDTFGFHSGPNDQSTTDFLRIYHRVKDSLLQ